MFMFYFIMFNFGFKVMIPKTVRCYLSINLPHVNYLKNVSLFYFQHKIDPSILLN